MIILLQGRKRTIYPVYPMDWRQTKVASTICSLFQKTVVFDVPVSGAGPWRERQPKSLKILFFTISVE